MSHQHQSTFRPDAPVGSRLVRVAWLIRDGSLDPELAALLSLLVEAGVPAVVASTDSATSDAVRGALLDLLPEDATVVRLAGAGEAFGWLPEAADLGWLPDPPGDGAGDRSTAPEAAARADSTVLVADLDPDAPAGTWGERALVAIRALSLGYGMLATARGARLEEVLGRLAAKPVGALDDELTRLGVVLILAMDATSRMRVAAAHYVRPVSRDAEGHVRRLPPAVLATWSPTTGRWEHFAWGIVDELAGRVGSSPRELEREQARRAGILVRLAIRLGDGTEKARSTDRSTPADRARDAG